MYLLIGKNVKPKNWFKLVEAFNSKIKENLTNSNGGKVTRICGVLLFDFDAEYLNLKSLTL